MHSPLPAILNKVQNEFTHSRPVKTIKKEKHMIHCFIVCSAHVNCIVIVIILEDMFLNVKSAVFTHGVIGEGEFCSSACMFADAQHQSP